MAKLKRYVDEMREHGSNELEIIDRGIVNFQDVPGICESNFLHRNKVLWCFGLFPLELAES